MATKMKAQSDTQVAGDARKLSEETAAIIRLSQGLGREKTDKHSLNISAVEYAQPYEQTRPAVLETKNRYFRPASTAIRPGNEVQRIPVLDTRNKDHKTGITLLSARIREEWRALDDDMRLLSASRFIGARKRRCIARAGEELARAALVLESRGNALKSEMNDRESSMGEIVAAQECNARDLAGCRSCCANNFPVRQNDTTPQGLDRMNKQDRCVRSCEIGSEMCRSLDEINGHASQTGEKLSGVLKHTSDHCPGNVKDLTGV